MKKHNLFVIIFLLVISSAAQAQSQFSGWLASFNTFKINKKFSVPFDAQLRSTDQWNGVQTILLRPGISYHLNKTVTLTNGYAFISGRRNVGGIEGLLPEHRIWQQALLSHKVKKIAVSHRLRFEERFISKAVVRNNHLHPQGHDQAFRFRYFIRGIVPFSSQPNFTKGPFFALQNEVFLNTCNKSAVNGKTFDQNRFYAAVGHRVSSKVDVEAGYLNQYTVTRTAFTNNHIAQVAVYKRL